MRFLTLAVLGLTLLAGAPAMADLPQNGGTPATGPHNFGGLNCPQRVPCPDSSEEMPSSQSLAENASNCVTQFLGMANTGDGFFDRNYGLDSKNCLTLNSTTQRMSGTRALPHCCITKASDNTCLFRCELIQ